MSKYGNKKIVIDGITFDSQLEASFYIDLKEMMKKNEILNFSRQVKIEICPAYKLDGKNITASNYVLDYTVEYFDERGDHNIAYIDIKGFGTDVSKLKKKLAQRLLGQRILWLEKNYQFGCKYGWVDQDDLKVAIKENKKKNKRVVKL